MREVKREKIWRATGRTRIATAIISTHDRKALYQRVTLRHTLLACETASAMGPPVVVFRVVSSRPREAREGNGTLRPELRLGMDHRDMRRFHAGRASPGPHRQGAT